MKEQHKQHIKRKDRILRVAKIQSTKHKRGHLESVLRQKLEVKYGKHTNNPISKSTIHQTIKVFLDCGSYEIIETNLKQIEHLISQVEARLQTTKNKESRSNGSIKKAPSSMTIESFGKKNNKKENSEYSISELNPWRVLETYQIKKAQDNLTKEREKEATDMRATVKVLNDQVNAKKKVERLNQLENEKFIHKQSLELESWRKGQEKAHAQKLEKIALLKNIRQNQITLQAQKRKIEAENRHKEELEEIAKAKADLEQSKMEAIQKKQREREKWENIKCEETQREHERAEINKKEKELDVKQMKEYKIKQEKEEKMRQELLSKRHTNSQLRLRLSDDNGQVLKMKEERNLQDMKITHEFQEREKAALERETKEKEARLVQMKQITKYNKLLADEKKKKELSIELKERDDYIKVNREREVAVVAEEEALRFQKIKGQKNYCKVLDEQVRSQNIRLVDIDNMTEVEKSINRKVLKKIESDLELKKEVYESLKVNG